MEKSKYHWSDWQKKITRPIEEFVFNELELKKNPLEERFIFRLGEYKSEYFFHKQIVDELLKIEPKVSGLYQFPNMGGIETKIIKYGGILHNRYYVKYQKEYTTQCFLRRHR